MLLHHRQLKNRSQKRRGAALVEYALLIAGVALICAAAVSIFGHKTNDMIAAIAAVLPGAHTDDNNPIASGHIIETSATGGSISVDVATIAANSGTARLGVNVGGGASAEAANGFGGLVTETGPVGGP